MPYRPVDTFRNSEMNRKTPARKILRVSLGQPLGPTPPEQFNVSGRKKSSSIAMVMIVIIVVHLVIAGGSYLNYKLNDEAEPSIAKEQTPPPSSTTNTLTAQQEPSAAATNDATAIAAEIANSNKTDSQNVLPDSKSLTPTITTSPSAKVEIDERNYIATPPAEEESQSQVSVGVATTSATATAEEEEELVAVEIPDTAVTPATKTASATVTRYQLVSGDSWGKVAGKFNISVKALQQANPEAMKKPRIYAGHYLNIPTAAGTAATVTATRTTTSSTQAAGTEGSYTVQDKDTLAAIAKKYNMKLQDLLDLNNLKMEDARRIRPGQVLKIKK